MKQILLFFFVAITNILSAQEVLEATSNYAFVRRGDEDEVLKNHYEKGGKCYALIIGVANYQNSNIDKLSRPPQDAALLADVLRNRYEFAQVKLLNTPQNTSRNSILRNITDLMQQLKENDSFLIFFAGHGKYRENEKAGYWLPRDAEKDYTTNWISNSSINTKLLASKAKHILVIADACYAGSFLRRSVGDAMVDAKGSVKQMYAKKSRKAMTSGAFEAVPDESSFLKYMIEDLKNNEKPYLPARDLFHQIDKSMRNYTTVTTTPQFGGIKNVGHNGGEFIFIRK